MGPDCDSGSSSGWSNKTQSASVFCSRMSKLRRSLPRKTNGPICAARRKSPQPVKMSVFKRCCPENTIETLNFVVTGALKQSVRSTARHGNRHEQDKQGGQLKTVATQGTHSQFNERMRTRQDECACVQDLMYDTFTHSLGRHIY